MFTSATSRAPSTSTASTGRCPTACRDPAAAGAAGGPLLHQLGAPADHRGARAGGRTRRSSPRTRPTTAGLKIRTTIDLRCRRRPQQAIDEEFPPGSGGPTARAGLDRQPDRRGPGDGQRRRRLPDRSPFNLATLGHRQPGSSFKPFTLAEALLTGEYTPYSVIDSAPQDFIVPNSAGKEHFIVHNFGNTYSGPITLAEATAISDNTVFSQVGIHVGTKRIARLAKRMGIRSPISDNYAMILGGLKIGVSPLDMAHAYETLATGGLKVYNPLIGDMDVPNQPGPTAIAQIECPRLSARTWSTIRPTGGSCRNGSTEEVRTMLEGVVGPGGTAPMAAIPGVVVAGKTGTTTNYADAWFVGWTPQLTTAVWVGYPQGAIPMTTDYNGAPVEGGTFPAIIWHNFMVQALQILANEQVEYGPHKAGQTHDDRDDAEPDSEHRRRALHSCRHDHHDPTNTTGSQPRPPVAQQRRRRHRRRHDSGQHRRRHNHAGRRPTPTPAPPPTGGTSGTGGAGKAAGLGAADCRRRYEGRTGADRNRLPRTRETPRQLDGLRDPDPRRDDDLERSRHAGGRPAIVTGPRRGRTPLSVSSTPSACVSFPGPRAEIAQPRRRPRRAASLDPRRAARARGSARPRRSPSGSQTAFSIAWTP